MRTGITCILMFLLLTFLHNTGGYAVHCQGSRVAADYSVEMVYCTVAARATVVSVSPVASETR